MLNNTQRADRARNAVVTYQGTDFSGAPWGALEPDDQRVLIQDLINDLAHLWDTVDTTRTLVADFTAMVRMAIASYDEEVTVEKADPLPPYCGGLTKGGHSCSVCRR